MPEHRNAGGILCPIDLADESLPVLRLAAALAKRCETTLTVLHTIASEAPPYFTPGGIGGIESERDREKATARVQALGLMERAGCDPDTNLEIEDGDPVEAIHRATEARTAALIVMGTHGRSGLSRIEEGSVATGVLRSSRIPVLTVGPRDSGHGEIASIVCPVTDSEVSRDALRWAAWLARCFGAPLTVLHVVEPASARPAPDICAWAESSRREGCSVQEVTRHGHAADEILNLTREAGGGLLVMGAQHKLIFDRTVVGATAE
ncbi:MAG: universal stress protein, partial [Acidobacteriota bacterium]|nr:universal stress protein [Acidobacteriota bacterium]